MTHSCSRRITFVLSLFLLIGVVPSTTQAMLSAITFNSLPAIVAPNQVIPVSGTVTERCTRKTVTVSWKNVRAWVRVTSVTADSNNQWKAQVTVPTFNGTFVLKADCGAYYSAQQATTISAINPIKAIGPGNRILGMDISRWQHISGQTIDFDTMAKAGIAFVIFKGSDGNSAEDALAQKYVFPDSAAAKRAGLIVGYYHVVKIPTGNVAANYIASATQQATLATKRLKSLGGYDGRTLPLTLDMEGVNSSVNQASLFLWTKTFIDTVTKLSGRIPMMYSYRSFLSSRYSRASGVVNKLRTMHLWLAQPGNPADPTIKVGGIDGKTNNCFHTAWAKSNCETVWTMWQYTNRGNRDTFGIPWRPLPGQKCPSHARFCVPGVGTGPHHLDLNVFNGNAVQLQNLISGTWVRLPSDYVVPSPTPSVSVSPSPSTS